VEGANLIHEINFVKELIRPPYLSDKAIHSLSTLPWRKTSAKAITRRGDPFSQDTPCSARCSSKMTAGVAGLELAEKIFQRFDPGLRVEFFKKDGDEIKKGDVCLCCSWISPIVLSTERVVLNCLQRMSGIAAYTHRLCRLIDGTKAQLMTPARRRRISGF